MTPVHVRLRFILLMLVAFALVLFLIRAQPYDDRDLRAFLQPTDCAAPCFMGIRPGVTTLDEAAQLLENSGWVDKVTDLRYQNQFYWSWNGHQPAFLDTSQGAALQHGAHDDIVHRITIPTNVPMGIIAFALGKPSWFQLSVFMPATAPYLRSMAYYSIHYADDFMYMDGQLTCPLRWTLLWQRPAVLNYSDDPPVTEERNWDEQLQDYAWCSR